MTTRYLLDTNIVSHLLRGHPAVVSTVTRLPMELLALSAVTEGELLFGLARRPGAMRLHRAVSELLLRVEVLAWDRDAAASYGELRSQLEADGRSLDALDLMIAAHAKSTTSTLASADRAFLNIDGLAVVDWTRD